LEEPLVETKAAAPVRLAKVLHVINGEHYSGAERVQDLLALALPALGFEVGFACVKPRRFPELRQAQRSAIHEIPMRSRIDLRAVGRLVRCIRQHDYKLVHAHTPRAALVGRLAAAIARVPLVYHVHSPTSRDTTHRFRNLCNAAAERLAVAGAAKLVAVSGSLGRHMKQQGIAARKIAVIHNGVPVAKAVTPRGTPTGVWTLGTIALFRPRKGLEVLIDALGLLRADGVPVQLRAVGGFETADYEQTIHEQVARLGLANSIEWTGFTSDVPRELEEMDLMVLPSLFGEGLPMVVLEAMAAGVPVVASSVEGVPEAIRDGLDGVLAAPGDPHALAAAIRRVIDGELDWQALRTTAVARHAEQFSDRAMAARLAEVYREILAGR
jgi:glycosyltransferase involved in cell wall biosynthesis